MHRHAAALAITFALLGCGRDAPPRTPGPSTVCAAEGTWKLAFDDDVPEIELTVEPDLTESLAPSNDGPGRVSVLLVQVDRARCRLHVVEVRDTRYSDDAGDRHEQTTVDVELDGDRGRVTGRHRIHDTSEEPMIDLDDPVTGTATRGAATEEDE